MGVAGETGRLGAMFVGSGMVTGGRPEACSSACAQRASLQWAGIARGRYAAVARSAWSRRAASRDADSPPPQPFTSQVIGGILEQLILSLSESAAGLKVEVEPTTAQQLLSGLIKSIRMSADSLCFRGLKFSYGVQLEISSIQLELPKLELERLLRNPLSLLSRNVRERLLDKLNTPPKLAEPCTVQFSATMSNSDMSNAILVQEALASVLIDLLINSLAVLKPVSPLLRLLQPLLPSGTARTVRSADIQQAQVRVNEVVAVSAWSAGRSSHRKGGYMRVQAEVQLAANARWKPITVLTGLAVAGDGRMVGLVRPELMVNMLGRSMPVPFGPIALLSIDLGPDLLIDQILIADGEVTMGGRAVVRPQPMLMSPASADEMRQESKALLNDASKLPPA
mmetsp:Transcript_9067/g.23863  ORF Transcript_9067/g.23863 Transcript_9067/m.23863 type:complete len:396 (+) Transcript_9067:89-1276(+)